MDFYLAIGFSFSVFIAGLIGIIRFKEIREAYYPFLIFIWIGCINELLSFLLMINNNYTIINGVIYDLIESVLLLYFFRNMGAFKRRPYLFMLLITFYILFWIVENFIIHKFGTSFDSYFVVIYSLPTVILSINTINKILLKEREILKSPEFLICVANTIFFTYRSLVETFSYFGLDMSYSFRLNVYIILIYINLLCNLIYAIAILWMKKRQAFSLQF